MSHKLCIDKYSLIINIILIIILLINTVNLYTTEKIVHKIPVHFTMKLGNLYTNILNIYMSGCTLAISPTINIKDVIYCDNTLHVELHRLLYVELHMTKLSIHI